MVQKTALLLGGSGLTGGHCLDYLLNDDHYKHLITLVRRPLSVAHPKLVQHLADFHRLDDCLAGMQCNDVFCCMGTTIKKARSKKAFYEVNFVYPTEIAELCLANGAEQFLLISALGADPGSAIFYNRVKGEVEEAIAGYGFKGFHISRPSLLLGKRRESRPPEKSGQKLFHWFSFIFKGGLQKYKPLESRAVAFAMVAVAKEQPLDKCITESPRIQAIYDERQELRNPERGENCHDTYIGNHTCSSTHFHWSNRRHGNRRGKIQRGKKRRQVRDPRLCTPYPCRNGRGRGY